MKQKIKKPPYEVEVEKAISELDAELTTMLSLAAKQQGEINRPSTRQWAVIKQAATSKVKETLQAIFAKNNFDALVARSKQPDSTAEIVRTQKNKADIATVEAERLRHVLANNKSYRSSEVKRWATLTLVVFIGFGEAVLCRPGFRHLGLGSLGAAIGSAAVGIAVILGTHYGAHYAKKASTPERRNTILAATCAGFCIAFAALTLMRVNAVIEDSRPLFNAPGTTQSDNSLWLGFAMFGCSVFLFLAGLIASVAVARTEEYAIAEDQYLDSLRRLKDAEYQQQAALSRIAEIESESKVEKESRFNKIEYLLRVEPRLRALLKSKLADFIQITQFGSDKLPGCMEDYLNEKDLPLSTNFLTQKSK